MTVYAHNAIGVLDSGVGGLTVVQEICRQMPHERVVYFGDTARMPYGPRSYEEVRRFALEIIRFLQTQEIKMVVVACNSATAAGIEYYQESCSIPVLGVIEPGVRAALAYTKNKRVGVIGTTGTIGSGAYQKALAREQPALQIIGRACPLFVLLVENDLIDTPEAKIIARSYLDPLKTAGIDTLILGCTHYPLMSGLIQEAVGAGVKLVSSAEETASEVKAILAKNGLLNPSRSAPRHSFFVSGKPASFERIGSKLLQQEIRAYQVILER